MAKTRATARTQIRSTKPDGEIAAMSKVYDALNGLDTAAQSRVIRYVTGRFGLSEAFEPADESLDRMEDLRVPNRRVRIRDESETEPTGELGIADETDKGTTSAKQPDDEPLEEGISPVALKWMKRGDISSKNLSKYFTIGVDEIDLVAKKVPGKNKAAKFRSVMLLKGVASYLGSGQAKIDHKALKEAVGHYGADPGNNITSYVKNISAEVSGTAASGYTLTPRGLTAAQELIQTMIDGKVEVAAR